MAFVVWHISFSTLQLQLSEILLKNARKFAIECYVDNYSLWENVHSTKSVTEKRLKIDLACIKEILEKRELSSVKWVDSSNQLSDCFTKRGTNTEKLLQVIRSGYITLIG